MGRVWQFVRRHWLGILSLVGVGVAVARPELLQNAAERVLQGVLNALVIVLGAAMTAIANTVARNGQSIAIGYVARQTPTLPVPTED